jgi:cyclophilin family peptidyl-prolyl cis-trans isomerase
MVDKPGRRKKSGHRGAYLAVTIVLILVAASISYAYIAGGGKGGPASTTCTTTTEGTTTANSSSPSTLYAQVNTTDGTFDVELFYSLAPATVTNFVNLVNQGFYSHLVWHRIQAGLVIQTGDPTTKNGGGTRDTWGQAASCVYVPFEDNPSLHNDEYYLGMASRGAGLGGSSQFYINLANNSKSFDGSWAVFGRVINATGTGGAPVVQMLGSSPTISVTMAGENGQTQPEPYPFVYVISITMLPGPPS